MSPLIVTTSRWAPIDRPLYPWVVTLDRIMRREPLEAMQGQLIHVFSDYSGAHKKSLYETTALLYVDVEASMAWEAQRLLVRQRYLSDGRRLSFKGLNDVRKQKALIPFLEAADRISGVCLVVAVHKSVRNLCWSRDLREGILERRKLIHKWNRHNFERMIQVTHLIGLLTGGLSLRDQELYWFSDEDELFANRSATEDLRNLLGFFSGHYVRHSLKQVGLGTTAIDEGDRYEEDHVAVADLAAGAAADMLTDLAAYAGRIPDGVALEFPGKFSQKTEIISSWLGDSSSHLKKVLVVFEARPPASYSVMRLNW